ncbi:SRPBCC family protein [Zavarzinella formosa]|uniref:SRPBCC family protein n=1 Tax=Zavarzinella formosa TaxID=360055 RepID=UPI0002FF53E4|nr:SRPBCC family protein [Zavarzinella formosa]
MASTILAVAAKSLASQQSAVGSAVERLPELRTNVSSTERWLSTLGGATLAAYGLSNGRLLPTLLGGFLLYRGTTGHCPVSQVLGVSTSDATAKNSVIAAGHGNRADASIVVKKPAIDVYDFWRDFENLPKVMTHLIDVDTTNNGESRWTAKGPLGLQVRWEAKITADEPGRLIAWKSLSGSDVDTAGSVHFTSLPGEQGTEVRVALKYDPPAGKLGTAVAWLFGENPQRQLEEDLERFREVMERIPMAR